MAIEFKTILLRGGTAGQWASANPVLADREVGLEEATSPANSPRFKVGDGVTAWNSLPYLGDDELATKVDIAGDNMTGSLTLVGGATPIRVQVDNNAGVESYYRFSSGGLIRWQLRKADAEGGGNAGGNFYLDRFNDAGTYLGTVLAITRSTGSVSIPLLTTTAPGAGEDSNVVAPTSWVQDRLQERRLTATANLNFPTTSSTGSTELTVSVPGAVVGDVVCLGPPNNFASNFAWCGYVSAADTVTVRLIRTTTGVDPAAGDWKIIVLK